MSWTPEFMGLGNVLYVWLGAWIEIERTGRQVLETQKMQPWLETFPDLRRAGLAIRREDVGFFRQRDRPWRSGKGSESYTEEQLQSFSREFLLSAPLFQGALAAHPGLDDPKSLTLNIRRGDYYSVPEFERLFGFDQVTYLKTAVSASIARNDRTDRIYVVSDGLDWCRENLAWLEDLGAHVEFADPTDSPQKNMLDVSSSRRLVLTNSTFSYWCGYLSGVIYPGNAADIWAPRFFARFDGTNGDSDQLNEAWSIVETIEGGWDRAY